MAAFKLEFDTGNAAFDDGNAEVEAARILRTIAERLEDHNAGSIYDINGNRIGFWSID